MGGLVTGMGDTTGFVAFSLQLEDEDIESQLEVLIKVKIKNFPHPNI